MDAHDNTACTKEGICRYCTNGPDACHKCDKHWRDMFIPSEDVKKYFRYGYNGVRGIRGHTYDFDTTSPDLKPTRHVIIDGARYCPYCGEQMYCIQDMDTLAVTGHCCICEGARAQLAYDEEEKALRAKHEAELLSLRNRYREDLEYDTEKLFAIKLEKEKARLARHTRHADYFATLNGEPYTDIEQLL